MFLRTKQRLPALKLTKMAFPKALVMYLTKIAPTFSLNLPDATLSSSYSNPPHQMSLKSTRTYLHDPVTPQEREDPLLCYYLKKKCSLKKLLGS